MFGLDKVEVSHDCRSNVSHDLDHRLRVEFWPKPGVDHAIRSENIAKGSDQWDFQVRPHMRKARHIWFRCVGRIGLKVVDDISTPICNHVRPVRNPSVGLVGEDLHRVRTHAKSERKLAYTEI